MKERILAIDVLRGLTIIMMILVNNIGDTPYPLLHHSAWHGLTISDTVFPTFLFILGITTYLSLKKYAFAPSRQVITKVLRRTVLLILIGWAIHLIENVCSGVYDLGELRLTGVLPRIALCYLATAFIALYVNHKHIPMVAFTIIVVYAIILHYGHGYLCSETSVIAQVDRALLTPQHLYHKSCIDPEGLLSTLPAIAHTLVGFIAVRVINKRDMHYLAIIGVLAIVTAVAWQDMLPINKRVWSPTFLLATTGIAALTLYILMYLIDVRYWTRWTYPLQCVGTNPLFIYVLSEIVAILLSTIAHIHGSITTAITLLVALTAIAILLHHRRLYIKL